MFQYRRFTSHTSKGKRTKCNSLHFHSSLIIYGKVPKLQQSIKSGMCLMQRAHGLIFVIALCCKPCSEEAAMIICYHLQNYFIQ